MTGRAFLETLLAAVLTLILSIGALAVRNLTEGSTLAEALESGAGSLDLISVQLAVTAIGWLIVNLAARRASSGFRFWMNSLVLFVVSVLAAAVWFVLFVLIVGGWGALIAVIGMAVTAGVFVAAMIALALVHLVFLRRRKVAVVV